MGFSIPSLLIILLIILLLFGTKKLKSLGSDLGGAIKGFKKAVSDENSSATTNAGNSQDQDRISQVQEKKEGQVIDGQAERVDPITTEKRDLGPK